MATIKATIDIDSPDILSYPIKIHKEMHMSKSANPELGLDETTGLRTKKFTAQTAAVIVEHDELTAETIGKLYGQDWMLMPYDGNTNITVASSTAEDTQYLEYMVFADGIVAAKG